MGSGRADNSIRFAFAWASRWKDTSMPTALRAGARRRNALAIPCGLLGQARPRTVVSPANAVSCLNKSAAVPENGPPTINCLINGVVTSP